MCILDNRGKLTAAVLAGGHSRRFGSSKMEAVFQGKRLVDYALETAKLVAEDSIIILGDQPLPADVRTLAFHDVIADSGPLGGVLTALHYASADWVAILPVDMPLLSPRVYEALSPFCSKDRPVVARSHFGDEPLVSLWPTLLLPTVREHVEAGHLKTIEAMNALDAVVVDIAASLAEYREEWFLNINRREDLRRLQRLMER